MIEASANSESNDDFVGVRKSQPWHTVTIKPAGMDKYGANKRYLVAVHDKNRPQAKIKDWKFVAVGQYLYKDGWSTDKRMTEFPVSLGLHAGQLEVNYNDQICRDASFARGR